MTIDFRSILPNDIVIDRKIFGLFKKTFDLITLTSLEQSQPHSSLKKSFDQVSNFMTLAPYDDIKIVGLQMQSLYRMQSNTKMVTFEKISNPKLKTGTQISVETDFYSLKHTTLFVQPTLETQAAKSQTTSTFSLSLNKKEE